MNRVEFFVIATIWFGVMAGAKLMLLATQPTHGTSFPATVTNVVDGDTIDVEIKRNVRIRLLDCWAPESRTKDLEEKKRGLAAKAYMVELADGKDVTVFVPMGEDVKESLTLNRFFGHVWLEGDEMSLSERMVEVGHAKEKK